MDYVEQDDDYVPELVWSYEYDDGNLFLTSDSGLTALTPPTWDSNQVLTTQLLHVPGPAFGPCPPVVHYPHWMLPSAALANAS